MRILACDLGTLCGWAYHDGHRMESGVQDFSLKRGESPGMRYWRFNTWLDSIFNQYIEQLGKSGKTGEPYPVQSPVLIVYEACHNRGGAATEVANGLTTRVQEFCARHGIEHASCHTSTLKKFATGSGRAGKEDMIKAASDKTGIPIQELTDDRADAIMLMFWALKEFGAAQEGH